MIFTLRLGRKIDLVWLRMILEPKFWRMINADTVEMSLPSREDAKRLMDILYGGFDIKIINHERLS